MGCKWTTRAEITVSCVWLNVYTRSPVALNIINLWWIKHVTAGQFHKMDIWPQDLELAYYFPFLFFFSQSFRVVQAENSTWAFSSSSNRQLLAKYRLMILNIQQFQAKAYRGNTRRVTLLLTTCLIDNNLHIFRILKFLYILLLLF